MPSPKWAVRVLVAVLLAGLFIGLTVMSRSSSHDAFPAYSSRRTGPMGASILYEVLGRSVHTDRNYLPRDQFRPKEATIFYLGIGPVTLATASDTALRDYEEIAKAGNRVVLGITSEDWNLDKKSKDLNNKRWGVRVAVSKDTDNKGIASYDVQPGPDWSRISEAGFWLRSFGKGSILLVTNAKRLTNESLAREYDAQELVPLLAGTSTVIVFDESHLGIAESGSIAGLMRRYRLVGLVAGLLLLTALFFWKNAVRFPPAPASEANRTAHVSKRKKLGTDLSAVQQVPEKIVTSTQARLSVPNFFTVGSASHDILAGLLETHVASDHLIDICVAEWNRVRRNRQITSSAWKGQDPVAAYRTITAELHQKGIKQ